MIPHGWSAHHAAVLPTSFNASVSVGYRDGTTYDPLTDETSSTWTVEYAGGARVQRLAGERAVELAGESLTGQPYLVEEDAGCPAVRRGARVRVTKAANVPDLVGQVLWVVSAPYGSERFTRSLLCSDAEQDASPLVTP